MSDEVKLFEGNKIRSVWDNEKEEWYFSVVDVVGALTSSPNPRDYWYRVKKRMSEEEKSQLSTICRQLKLEAADGKKYNTDAADMQGIFRIIQSIPSPKAEPFKMWLAEVGKERSGTDNRSRLRNLSKKGLYTGVDKSAFVCYSSKKRTNRCMARPWCNRR